MRLREQQRAEALGQTLADHAPPSPQGRALDRVQAGEIWAVIQTYCHGERERLVAYCYLMLGLKPSDIQALYPDLFASTTAINSIQATLLKRLRRSPTLRRQCRAS
jgi:hypothetical protein